MRAGPVLPLAGRRPVGYSGPAAEGPPLTPPRLAALALVLAAAAVRAEESPLPELTLPPVVLDEPPARPPGGVAPYREPDWFVALGVVLNVPEVTGRRAVP